MQGTTVHLAAAGAALALVAAALFAPGALAARDEFDQIVLLTGDVIVTTIREAGDVLLVANDDVLGTARDAVLAAPGTTQPLVDSVPAAVDTGMTATNAGLAAGAAAGSVASAIAQDRAHHLLDGTATGLDNTQDTVQRATEGLHGLSTAAAVPVPGLFQTAADALPMPDTIPAFGTSGFVAFVGGVLSAGLSPDPPQGLAEIVEDVAAEAVAYPDAVLPGANAYGAGVAGSAGSYANTMAAEGVQAIEWANGLASN